MFLSRAIFVLTLGVAWVASIACQAATPEGIQFFESKIRPVLVERCYRCHSAAAAAQKKLKGKLLLDTRDAIRKGGESGPAVVPKDVKASLLIAAIRHESIQMPPDTKLPDTVIADFVKWVELGAPDPRDGSPEGAAATTTQPTIDLEAGRKFRSFQPLSEVAPPATGNAWARNGIDQFILAALQRKSLSPNEEATRQALIRRVYFDLWGLPPEPADVEQFVNDSAPDAYERLVDRLLEGDHYGERSARHWLDLARFAESNGYAFDKDRPGAFHYRDFVIKSLNQDMPYDEFVRLQLAGDQIAPQDYMAQAATGFLAAGTFTSQQTQKERERSRYEQLDDIAATIGTSMLGLTVGCARCHDHKFDPLPTRDYYRFIACFAETGFQDYDHDSDPAGTKAAKDKFDAEHKPFVDARVKYEGEQLAGKLETWLASRKNNVASERLGPWHAMGPFTAGDFKKTFSEAFNPEKMIDTSKPDGDRKWVEHADWKDGQVHNTLTGDNSANYLYREIEVDADQPLEVSLGYDDAIKVFLNGSEVFAKETMGGASADQAKVTLQLNKGTNGLLLKIVNAGGPSGFYFSTKPGIPKNIEAILKVAADKRNDAQRQQLLKWYAPRDAPWAELNKAEQDHLKKQPKPQITKVYAARKNGATYNFGGDTRKVYFLARGNSNSKQGLAEPGFLTVLTDKRQTEFEKWLSPATPPAGPGPATGQAAEQTPAPPTSRIALAHWMTDTETGAGHLLARVIVNRLWQHHMGRGIVATPSDFGSQGAPPTHPELLDFLAGELIRHQWKLKPIHRLIMTSAVYRQTGESNPAGLKTDPGNQLWWRRPAQRLDAEAIRDTLLAVSGGLDKTMYGKGALDEANPRRSVYLTVKRSNLIPILQLFDAPDSIQSIGQRNVTTVPPQALAMMNSTLARQLAEKFAQRIRQPEMTTVQIVESAYWTALSRPPSEAEAKRMTEFIDTQTASYTATNNGNVDQAKTLAVADFCQLVFCLNEFVFID